MENYLKNHKTPIIKSYLLDHKPTTLSPHHTSKKRSRNGSLIIPSNSQDLSNNDNEASAYTSINFSDDEEDPDMIYWSDSSDKTPPSQTLGKHQSSGRIDDAVLKHRNKTRATPLLRRLAGKLFGQNIASIEGSNYDLISGLDNITCDPATLRDQFKSAVRYSSFTSNARFEGPKIWFDYNDDKERFGIAIIDGEKYQPSDYILVRAPCEQSSPNQDYVSSSHEEAEPFRIRFARLSYLYEEYGSKYAHVRWFEHGSQIPVLQELAGPRALFILTECQDIQLTSIAGKINVDYIGPGSAQGGLVESRFTEPNHFFYQFHFDEKSNKIADASIAQTSPTKGQKYCDCCEEKGKQEKFYAAVPIGTVASDGSLNGFRYQGVNYHLDDFVYGLPTEGSLSNIFQIAEISLNIKNRKKILHPKADIPATNVELVVRVLGRADELLDLHGFMPQRCKDNRQVFISNKFTTIPATDLEGKCQVKHITHIDDFGKYREETDNFWVEKKVTFPDNRSNGPKLQVLNHLEIHYSLKTELELAKLKSAKERYLSSGQIPQGLELFGGVGGLTLGIDTSGAVETKNIVEFAPASAKTAEENMGWLIAHNEDISSFLVRAFQANSAYNCSRPNRSRILNNSDHDHSHSENQTDLSGDPVRSVPKLGEVQFISAGFPCPGYSLANRSPRADDVKNTLILPTLSAIELYRPAYVLLENVNGLLNHRLGAQQFGRLIRDGIPQGTVKFVCRTLTLLGYQVQFAVLQAGEYSTPQSRQRVIFWAALQGYELPQFPQATTTFEGRCTISWHRTRRSASHRGYSVADATIDLPRFDWVNPHNVLPTTYEEEMEMLDRAERVEQIKMLQHQNYVGHNEQEYATSPRNELQKKLRVGVSKLTNHVTESWFDKPSWSNKKSAISCARTEQVCNIAMKAGADFTSLPKELTPWYLSHPDSAAAKNFDLMKGRFGRLDATKHFPICLTSTDPGRKGVQIIHPNQHRILSVREYARAQGFPDSFKWDLDTIDTKLAYRMIGNAVPPPLAEALGRELLKTLISQFEKGSPMPLFNPSCASKAFSSLAEEKSEEQAVWDVAIQRSMQNLEKNQATAGTEEKNPWMKGMGNTIDDPIELENEEE